MRRRRRASVHTPFAGIATNHVPGFIIAQLMGATCAALVAKVLFEPAKSG
jgi:glycerol uptake facilitator-like aquaporin